MIKLLLSISWMMMLNFMPVMNQTSPEEFLKIAIQKTEQGNYSESINYCSKAIVLDKDYELAYYQRGYNYYMLGEYELAKEDFNKTLEFNPNNAQAYIMRAECHSELGNRMKSIKDYNRARKIDFFLTMGHISKNLFNTILPSGK
ncbi:MAG: tetratricopeptide repeat protein [Bacteroidales bacterium]|nr:tetratricopeptide repeat protein [Bacteroidales bacterium]